MSWSSFAWGYLAGAATGVVLAFLVIGWILDPFVKGLSTLFRR